MNLSFGAEVIYEDAAFQLGDKDKAGIVGVNGAGKTTLFRLLLGDLALDSGTLTIGKGAGRLSAAGNCVGKRRRNRLGIPFPRSSDS